jgi:hypothetical protein
MSVLRPPTPGEAVGAHESGARVVTVDPPVPCPHQPQGATRRPPRPWDDTLNALLRSPLGAGPALQGRDLDRLLAPSETVAFPRRRPPGDPELLALREADRARKRRFLPPCRFSA